MIFSYDTRSINNSNKNNDGVVIQLYSFCTAKKIINEVKYNFEKERFVKHVSDTGLLFKNLRETAQIALLIHLIFKDVSE